MSAEALRRGGEAVEARLLEEPGPWGARARLEAGRRLPGDGVLLGAYVEELLASQQPDGSWAGPDGALAATAAALVELAELQDLLDWPRAAPPPPAVVAGLHWLNARRDRPGRFGEGCAPAWHEAGLCHHFLACFHAPGEALEPDLRVVQSALALRAGLLWGEGTAGATALELHLDGVRQVVAHWCWPGEAPLLPARAGVSALAAVLEAPPTPANIASAADGVACLVRTQRADGTWHGVELYDALDVLLLGIARGFRVEEVDRALACSAELLALAQENGARNGAPSGRRALIAWRTFRHALGHPGPEPIPA